jgi:4'-phosphopantetheinyl transferase
MTRYDDGSCPPVSDEDALRIAGDGACAWYTHGGVSVWRLELSRSPAQLAELWRLLSLSEQAKARRFVYEVDRSRYVAAHGLMRCALAQCVDAGPRDLEFAAGPEGKPRWGRPALGPSFNLSHAGELGLLAVAWGREVGVDIEKIRSIEDLDNLASTCLSSSEAAQLGALPEAERLMAFFECWTRKEAFLKALGVGLSRPLDSFAVTLGPGKLARLVHVDGDSTAAARWTLVSLTPAAGYVGALAMETLWDDRQQ